MDQKKMEEIMQDEGFVKQIASMATKEEIQQAFKAKGLEVTMEELDKFEADGKKALDEGELELVSGGLLFNRKKTLEPPGENATFSAKQDFVAEALSSKKDNEGWSNKSIGLMIVGGLTAAVGLGYAGYKYYKKRKAEEDAHKIK